MFKGTRIFISLIILFCLPYLSLAYGKEHRAISGAIYYQNTNYRILSTSWPGFVSQYYDESRRQWISMFLLGSLGEVRALERIMDLEIKRNYPLELPVSVEGDCLVINLERVMPYYPGYHRPKLSYPSGHPRCRRVLIKYEGANIMLPGR